MSYVRCLPDTCRESVAWLVWWLYAVDGLTGGQLLYSPYYVINAVRWNSAPRRRRRLWFDRLFLWIRTCGKDRACGEPLARNQNQLP